MKLLKVLLGAVLALAVLLLVVTFWLRLVAPAPQPAVGWSEVAAMPTARSEHAVAVTRHDDGERLWVVGGMSGWGRTLDIVEVYDPQLDGWREGPSLPEPRHHLGAAALGDSLYVAGGAPDALSWEAQSTLWRLGATDDHWETMEAMPEGRWGHRMVAVDGRLFVVGGQGETARVLIYDPEDGWSTGAALDMQRDHLMAVAVGTDIWAIGGRDGRGGQNHSRVDIYSTQDDSWRSGPPLPYPTSGASEGLVDDTIFIIAGEDAYTLGGGIVRQYWQLDITDEDLSWEPAPAPMLAVHGAEGAVVNGRLHVAGGAAWHGAWSLFSWTDAVQRLDDPDAAY